MTNTDALGHAIERLRELGMPVDLKAAKTLEKKYTSLRLKNETRAAVITEDYSKRDLELPVAHWRRMFRETTCQCGRPKATLFAFCLKHCWPRLTPVARKALHVHTVGFGFEQAMEAASKELEAMEKS